MQNEWAWQRRWGRLMALVTLSSLVFDSSISLLWLITLPVLLWWLGTWLLAKLFLHIHGDLETQCLYRDAARLCALLQRDEPTLCVELSDALRTRRTITAHQLFAELQELALQKYPPKSLTRESLEAFALACFLAVSLRACVVEAFKIPSASMNPTLEVGDHILVNKFLYSFDLPFLDTIGLQMRSPRRGDVIVFRSPNPPYDDFIKRVVGLPGDLVELRDGRLLVNGVGVELHDEGEHEWLDTNSEGLLVPRTGRVYSEAIDGRTHHVLYDGAPWLSQGPWRVQPEHYFVMGDNRDSSEDSRMGWQVPRENIRGHAVLIWWSTQQQIQWKRIGTPIQ